MTGENIMIDLTPFCEDDEEDARLFLQNPFSAGEFTYATDGRVLIRVPRRDGVGDGGPNLEEILPVLEKALSERAFGRLPPCETIPGKTWPPGTCPDCKGSGKFKNCTKCEGTGEVACGECGNEKDCDECEGAGWVVADKDAEGDDISQCDECEGSGDVESMRADIPDLARFPDQDFQLRYIDLIKALPGVEVAFGPSTATVGYADCPLVFRFDGGCGLLMPMRREAEPQVAEAAE